MKKNKLIYGITGVIIGVLLSSIFNFWFLKPDFSYFILNEDTYIGEVGTLKKGTILRYDDSYPEGFTRFILYLNVKGIDLRKSKEDNDNKIKPYWLEKK